MAEITSCVPPAMEQAVRELERDGWRIHSVRGDTGYMIASYYGAAALFRWNGEELEKIEHLKGVAS